MVRKLNNSRRSSKKSIKENLSEKEQLDNLQYVFDHLLEAWGEFSDVVLSAYVDNDLLDEIITEDYPFDRSFDEVDIDVNTWLAHCAGRIRNKKWNL